MKLRFAISTILIGGFLLAGTAEAGNPKKGKANFMVCVACHGLNGEGNKAFNSPRLTDQEDWYLKRQILKFKSRIRGGDPNDLIGMQMAPMVQILINDEAVDDVVAYIRTLKTDLPVDPSAGDPAKGQPLYLVCATCHGDQALGKVEQKAPRLQGQHAWYLSRQLKNFRDGIRGAHPQDAEGLLMRPMSMTLGDDQAVENITAYIQSLGADSAEQSTAR